MYFDCKKQESSMINKLFLVLILMPTFGSLSQVHGQWRGGEGGKRVGTGLRDAIGSSSGQWYLTGALDWIQVENMAKDRARANGHPGRYEAYLVRFMPEPPLFNPMPNPIPLIPMPPPTNYDFTYWAREPGIYKPGKPTEGNPSLSDNGRFNNRYREIRFVKIMYRGPAEIDSYNAAVREVLTSCKDKDQTHEMGGDNSFVISPSKDVGPNRKYIFAWGDDISKDHGYVVVDGVENGKIYCMLNKGQKRVAVNNPNNFYDWYLGSYRGQVSGKPSGGGASLAYVPMGQRNLFVSVQLWLHQGNIAASFRIRDLQEKN